MKLSNCYIYSHDPNSEGAKVLAEALGIKRIKHENSKFKGNNNKLVINWGSSKVPDEVDKCQMLNVPLEVSIAANKLTFFHNTDKDLTPPWTINKAEVRTWLEEGHEVCARTKLTGSGGDGLVIFCALDNFVDAPLYTKYIKKKDEYRVHFANGGIIDIQRKALKDPDNKDREINWKIRNLENGFIFMREGVEENTPEKVKEVAQKYIDNTDLNFGAIDIIYNSKYNTAYILEVNTAPGLVGTTVEKYAQVFKDLIANL